MADADGISADLSKMYPAAEKRDFQAEMYGRVYKGDDAYFPPKLVNYTVLERPRMSAPEYGANPVIYFSVDPASHEVRHSLLGGTGYSRAGMSS
jgi:hypothetical protein